MQEINQVDFLNSMPLSGKHHSISAVYKITNKVNGKVYVGATGDYFSRVNQHICATRKSTPKSKISTAIKKHGAENFVFSVIEVSLHDNDIMKEREQYWINELRSCQSRFGYNASQRRGRPPRCKNKETDWIPIGTYVRPATSEYLAEMKKRGYVIAKLVNSAILAYCTDMDKRIALGENIDRCTKAQFIDNALWVDKIKREEK